MIERIVVPLDGSLTAEAILPQVRRVLYRNDSELILVRAVQPMMVENAIMAAEVELAAAREYVLGQLERLEKAGVRARYVARIGTPAEVILSVAQEQKATLIAMATHGASGVKRFLFGSVAEAVIRQSPIPVLLVRPFWSYELASAVRPEKMPVRNVLVPVDGSDLSLEAVPGIVEFADLFESRVMLLRVLGEGEDKADAERQLQALIRTFEKRGVEAVALVEKGDPVEEILKTVGSHAVDLVAMTTHGRSGLSRLVSGSVTEQILRRATVPVLITRSGIGAGVKATPLENAVP
jgi:nucleotide-binding universal stress UspA family protein